LLGGQRIIHCLKGPGDDAHRSLTLRKMAIAVAAVKVIL
jgi:hypothetical protein